MTTFKLRERLLDVNIMIYSLQINITTIDSYSILHFNTIQFILRTKPPPRKKTVILELHSGYAFTFA